MKPAKSDRSGTPQPIGISEPQPVNRLRLTELEGDVEKDMGKCGLLEADETLFETERDYAIAQVDVAHVEFDPDRFHSHKAAVENAAELKDTRDERARARDGANERVHDEALHLAGLPRGLYGLTRVMWTLILSVFSATGIAAAAILIAIQTRLSLIGPILGGAASAYALNLSMAFAGCLCVGVVGGPVVVMFLGRGAKQHLVIAAHLLVTVLVSLSFVALRGEQHFSFVGLAVSGFELAAAWSVEILVLGVSGVLRKGLLDAERYRAQQAVVEVWKRRQEELEQACAEMDGQWRAQVAIIQERQESSALTKARRTLARLAVQTSALRCVRSNQALAEVEAVDEFVAEPSDEQAQPKLRSV